MREIESTMESEARPNTAAARASNPDGTQAIRRAAALLKAIAASGRDGASLAQLAPRVQLPRSTAHRILKCLVDEGLVEAEAPPSRRYRMGPLVHELGLIPMRSSVEAARWRHTVEEVARRTGATAYLMRRSGIEAVCLVKVDGSSVVRFVPVEVGQRRLLGVGGGATALLAALDPQQIDEVIDEIASLGAPSRIDAASLRESVARTKRTGFAISEAMVVADGFGLGAAIPSEGAPPHLAISIAAHRSIVNDEKVAEWKRILAEEIRAGSRAPARSIATG